MATKGKIVYQAAIEQLIDDIKSGKLGVVNSQAITEAQIQSIVGIVVNRLAGEIESLRNENESLRSELSEMKRRIGEQETLNEQQQTEIEEQKQINESQQQQIDDEATEADIDALFDQ